jgi:subtilisin family serine protease
MRKHTILFCVNIGIIFLAAAFFSRAAGVPDRDCGCTSMPEGRSSGVSAEKLINCVDIMNGFTAGRERVKVIVNLVEPAAQKAKTNWTSRQSLKSLQNKIRDIQNPVLASFEPREFKLRYRFENQAGFSGEVTLAGLEKLKNNPRVVSVEPVFMLEPHLRQGIPLMNADTYRFTYDGNGIAIAICDTGIDYTHPMLGNGGFPNSKVIGGYDYGDGDSDPAPHSLQAHGTCCAGIAAGDLNDTGDYIGGVAHNAKLYALKITPGSEGYAYDDAMVAAWNWCVSHKDDDPNNPIMVISTSFGGGRHYSACDSYLPSMTTAADNAVAAGITVLASSGNDGYCDSIAWPSCISSVISVGAVYDDACGTYYPCVSSGSCAAKYPTTDCYTGYYAVDNTYGNLIF